MKYYMRKIQSGKVLEVEQYGAIRSKGVKLLRGININPTTIKQKLLNEINAKRWLSRLVNSNFQPQDSYITLTYRGKQPTPAVAKKDLQRYLRRLRDLRKKKGQTPLKYIWVTECRDGRIHHHVIVQRTPEQVLIDLWQYDAKYDPIPGHGRAPCDRLDWSYDYTFLARYIGKEAKEGKRWGQSKGLFKPKITEKEIARSTIRRSYRPPKGYRVEEERFDYSDMSGEYRYVRLVPMLDMLENSA